MIISSRPCDASHSSKDRRQQPVSVAVHPCTFDTGCFRDVLFCSTVIGPRCRSFLVHRSADANDSPYSHKPLCVTCYHIDVMLTVRYVCMNLSLSVKQCNRSAISGA